MVKSIATDRAFAAMGDPTRLGILRRLTRGEATVTELAAPFDMSLPAVLKHVSILAEAGLIVSEKDGRSRRCRLDARALHRAERWIQQSRRAWEQRLDKLAEVLDKEGKR